MVAVQVQPVAGTFTVVEPTHRMSPPHDVLVQEGTNATLAVSVVGFRQLAMINVIDAWMVYLIPAFTANPKNGGVATGQGVTLPLVVPDMDENVTIEAGISG